MVKIQTTQKPTFDESGEIQACGCITLSNQISIWFCRTFPIKTLEQATEIANNIIQSLNQKS